VSSRWFDRIDRLSLVPASLLPPDDPTRPLPRTARDWMVDVAMLIIAVGVGVLTFSGTYNSAVHHVSDGQVLLDLGLGLVGCGLLWWRRRFPVTIAIVTAGFSTFSSSTSAVALLALFTVAVHRRTSITLAVAIGGMIPGFLFLLWRPQTEKLWVDVVVSVSVAAVMVTWGMCVRARRQLVWTLRERAERAEAEQQLRAEQARAAERTRIAREMHDVLAHRISLVALHAGALEVNPDLPPAKVRESAEFLRTTAHQALEELRGAIGVLRGDAADDAPSVPQPTLRDIPRLVEQTRRAGAKIDFTLDVSADAPTALGRDAYRIVQEALTNAAKHAPGAATTVRVSGAPEAGLSVSVRNRQPLHVGATVPGSGSGLIGLRERVDLAGGTLSHGPDARGDFVVAARLPWQ
jgi:signal transduction histidine kinase